jgi:hypothetical protein
MNNVLPANVEGRNAKCQEDFESLAPKQFAPVILAKAQRSVEEVCHGQLYAKGTRFRH